MSSTIEQPVASPLSADASRALGERLGDPAWLSSLRARAAAEADSRELPNSRSERPWKYLDISGLRLDVFNPALDAAARPTADEAKQTYSIAGDAAGLAFESNSEVVFAESYAPGVHVRTLREAGDQAGTAVPFDRNRLTALHYAFLRDGVVVTTDQNAEVAGPVRIVRDYADERQLGTPHTLIVTAPNSRVTVVEEYRSGDGPVLILPAVEILPGQGSEVHYVAIHNWGDQTRVLGEQEVITGQDASVVSFHVALGGRTIKEHITGSLVGRGSSSEIYGATLGDGQQHVDFFTLQDHVGADTRSDLLIKAALYGSSRAVYYGLTRVGLESKNADANQENRNILLSDDARADSDPVLEILTSNVIRASHGATAGPVDEEQLYYLQTRGIARPDAEALLVRGYLGEVLARLSDESVREELIDLVERKLERQA
jgi:Fe-S cluster assembly protein SufD